MEDIFHNLVVANGLLQMDNYLLYFLCQQGIWLITLILSGYHRIFQKQLLQQVMSYINRVQKECRPQKQFLQSQQFIMEDLKTTMFPLRELNVHKFLNGYNKKEIRLLNTKADAQHYHDNIGEVRVQKDPSNALDFHVDFPEKFEQDWENLLMWQEDIEREGKMHKVLHIHLPATSRDFTLSTSFHTMTTTNYPPKEILFNESLIMKNNQSHILLNIPLFEEIAKNRAYKQESLTNKTTLINIEIPSTIEKMFNGSLKLLVNGRPMAESYSAKQPFWIPKNITKVGDVEYKTVFILRNNNETSTRTTQLPQTHPLTTTSTDKIESSSIDIKSYIKDTKKKSKKKKVQYSNLLLLPFHKFRKITTTGINKEQRDESLEMVITNSTSSVTTVITTTTILKTDSTETTSIDSTTNLNSKSPSTLHNITTHSYSTVKIIFNKWILKKIKYDPNKPKLNQSAWPKSNYIEGNWFLVTGGKGNAKNESEGIRGIGLNHSVICGGFSKTNLIVQKCYIYKDGVWNSHVIPPIPSVSRGSLVSVRTKLYLIGGKNEESSKPSSKTLVFDYDKWNKWKKGTTLQKSREGACTVVWKGILIVMGGGDGSNYFSDSEIYDTNGGWKWKPLPWDMNLKRKYHGCAVLESVIYVVGGIGSKDSSRTIECVDFNSNTGWKLVTRLHSPRNFYPQVQIIQRDMFVFYGKTHPTNTFEIIELDSKSWLKRRSRTALMDARVFTLSNKVENLDTCSEFIRAN
ncbi:KLHL12 [Lepeophtheirus salmonis]|uniref:KLHL12 n=1 Tax=Lepeophtheirus salmonis TaxID=72036 RepID=A0A7R8CWH1_LEPSM|nr:KLHL12 [Lepeophtheirus salmonis]CAF2920976.1 KLHL12 [Lepeophtheirus salmonis]